MEPSGSTRDPKGTPKGAKGTPRDPQGNTKRPKGSQKVSKKAPQDPPRMGPGCESRLGILNSRKSTFYLHENTDLKTVLAK